jgi:hypothetical protein
MNLFLLGGIALAVILIVKFLFPSSSSKGREQQLSEQPKNISGLFKQINFQADII